VITNAPKTAQQLQAEVQLHELYLFIIGHTVFANRHG